MLRQKLTVELQVERVRIVIIDLTTLSFLSQQGIDGKRELGADTDLSNALEVEDSDNLPNELLPYCSLHSSNGDGSQI
jgi:hypothetical protein